MERKIKCGFPYKNGESKAPEEMISVDFHGEPVLIPPVVKGEPMHKMRHGISCYTERQAKVLMEIEVRKVKKMADSYDRTIYE